MSDATESMQPKFRVGDLVEHRASRERGVVVRAVMRCATHQSKGFSFESLTCADSGHGLEDCAVRFEGRYIVDTGFATDRAAFGGPLEPRHVSADEMLLRLVERGDLLGEPSPPQPAPDSGQGRDDDGEGARHDAARD